MKRNGMMDIAYLLAPELPEKVPCLQAEHDDWPFGLAFPAEHLVHVTELPFENVPELHGVQDVAPLLTLLVLDPARHSKHTSVWGVGAKRPAGHFKHSTSWKLNSPASHERQATLFSTLSAPFSHGMHLVEPNWAVYLPGSQILQVCANARLAFVLLSAKRPGKHWEQAFVLLS